MYEHEKTCEIGPGGAPSRPEENLTDMLRETRVMVLDALSMSRKIKSHLFGIRQEDCTGEVKQAEPCCFRDELGEVRRNLMSTCHELAEFCQKIGV